MPKNSNSVSIRMIDIGLLMLLTWGGVNGYNRGFLVELLSVASFALSGLISVKLLDPIAAICVRWSADWGRILPYVAFILIFFVTVIGINLLGRLLKHLIQSTLLGNLDKMAGGVLGMFKWGMLASVCLWVAKYFLQLEIPAQYTEHTVIFPVVERMAPQCFHCLFAVWTTIQARFFPHMTAHPATS